jgi:WD40 repeat protein
VTTLSGHEETVSAACFMGSDQVVTASHDRTIRVWRLEDGKLQRTVTAHDDKVAALDVGQEQGLLVSGGWDGVIWLGSAQPPDGEKERNHRDAVLGRHMGYVHSVALSPDERWIASAGQDRTIRVWAVSGDQPCRLLFDPAITEKGTAARQISLTEPEMLYIACDAPLPPDSVCICDCVGVSRQYSSAQLVCTCDTVTVASDTGLPAGVVCTCDTVAVGSRVSHPEASGSSRRGGSTSSTYWYPN